MEIAMLATWCRTFYSKEILFGYLERTSEIRRHNAVQTDLFVYKLPI